MRIEREIHDQHLAQFLQTADEEVLRTLLEDMEAEAELAAAIEHGKQTDDPADFLSAREYLASSK
ncbi:hypothetical protein [Endothiovibrio diazotrophicus]